MLRSFIHIAFWIFNIPAYLNSTHLSRLSIVCYISLILFCFHWVNPVWVSPLRKHKILYLLSWKSPQGQPNSKYSLYSWKKNRSPNRYCNPRPSWDQDLCVVVSALYTFSCCVIWRLDKYCFALFAKFKMCFYLLFQTKSSLKVGWCSPMISTLVTT